nr:hypothetical protein [Nitratireductor aquibiodomus]
MARHDPAKLELQFSVFLGAALFENEVGSLAKLSISFQKTAHMLETDAKGDGVGILGKEIQLQVRLVNHGAEDFERRIGEAVGKVVKKTFPDNTVGQYPESAILFADVVLVKNDCIVPEISEFQGLKPGNDAAAIGGFLETAKRQRKYGIGWIDGSQ